MPRGCRKIPLIRVVSPRMRSLFHVQVAKERTLTVQNVNILKQILRMSRSLPSFSLVDFRHQSRGPLGFLADSVQNCAKLVCINRQFFCTSDGGAEPPNRLLVLNGQSVGQVTAGKVRR